MSDKNNMRIKVMELRSKKKLSLKEAWEKVYPSSKREKDKIKKEKEKEKLKKEKEKLKKEKLKVSSSNTTKEKTKKNSSKKDLTEK